MAWGHLWLSGSGQADSENPPSPHCARSGSVLSGPGSSVAYNALVVCMRTGTHVGVWQNVGMEMPGSGLSD